jgi:formylglycine-generating enzyme required for sulfatase activity
MAFGDDETQLGDYAWYAENSEAKTHPDVTKKPNPFGHSDMHGNVWQWVEDCYHASYEEAPSDRSAWVEPCSIIRVVRGGSRFGIPDFPLGLSPRVPRRLSEGRSRFPRREDAYTLNPYLFTLHQVSGRARLCGTHRGRACT